MCNTVIGVLKLAVTTAPTTYAKYNPAGDITGPVRAHRGAVIKVNDGGEKVLLGDGFERGVQRIRHGAGAVQLPQTGANVHVSQSTQSRS